jgi:hypothetical protein
MLPEVIMPYWKDVVGFFMVSVPAVWVGTLILAWMGRRLSAKPPYASYEEFRRDVLGEAPIDEILDRCAGRIPFKESLVEQDVVYDAIVQDLLKEASANDLNATPYKLWSPPFTSPGGSGGRGGAGQIGHGWGSGGAGGPGRPGNWPQS